MASSGQQQTPYIGSKISLISKSEIRYEGILYTVDTNESTIALAKVKSYGTEGRKTEHPVESRDEIYEYIIFKASDIKDLMVSETPKPPPMFGTSLPYDPAIVSVSTQQPKTTNAVVQSPTNRGAAASDSSSRSATPHAVREVSPTTNTGVQTGNDYSHNRAAVIAPAQRSNNNPAYNNLPRRGAGGADSGGDVRGGFQQPFYAQQNAPSYRGALLGNGGPPNVNGAQSRGGFGTGFAPLPPAPFRNGGRGGFRDYDDRRPIGGGGAFRGGFRGAAFRGAPGTYPSNAGGWRGGHGGFDNGGGGPPQQQMPRGRFVGRGGGGRTIARGSLSRSGEQPLKFDGDYDWEKANLDFEMDKLKVDVSKVKIDGVDSDSALAVVNGEQTEQSSDDQQDFYDKTRSFFDHISCESLERENGENRRPNWRKERETNAETFGQTAVRNLNYRRGGGFRGGFGARAFHRGGGFQNRGGFGGGPRGGYNRRGIY